MELLCNHKSDLRVLLVSTSYPESSKDWKARFIADMVEALSRCKGIKLETWAPPGSRPPGVKDIALHEEAEWLKKLMDQGGIAHILRVKGIRGTCTIFKLLVFLRRVYRRQLQANKTDVVHVNWLQNTIPLWGNSKAAVIGVLGSDFGLLRLPGMRLLLRSVLRKRKCILAPNAEWMTQLLKKIFGDIAEIRPIPFGVDKNWFNVERKMPKDRMVRWITISRLTRNKIGKLFKWGEGLFSKEWELHLFGPRQEKISLPEWVVYHGPTHPAELREEWFPIASGLITLSEHHEGRPQVILEAMAAGLPVIASDLPAHCDVIQHRETGWLASSSQNFRDGLIFLSNPKNNGRIGEAARAWVTKYIGTWDDCAMRYIAAYHDLLEEEV